VREFAPGFVARLASLADAMCLDDDALIYRALVALDAVADDAPYDPEAARWLLRALFGPMLRDEVAAFELKPHAVGVREVVRRWRRAKGFSLGGELLFLLRTALGLSSVLARLGARANWYRRLQDLLDAQVAAGWVRATPTGGTPWAPLQRRVEAVRRADE